MFFCSSFAQSERFLHTDQLIVVVMTSSFACCEKRVRECVQVRCSDLVTDLNSYSFLVEKRERHHPTGKRRKIGTTQKGTGKKHPHTNEEKEGSTTKKER